MAVLRENENHCLQLGADLTSRLLKCKDDPLAMWLANYIAQLMRELEAADEPAQLARTSSACMDAILKLWEHRTLIPSVDASCSGDRKTSRHA